ncbi:MAG: glycosyltransferase family 4 protein [Candidatus Binatia bacterium]
MAEQKDFATLIAASPACARAAPRAELRCSATGRCGGPSRRRRGGSACARWCASPLRDDARALLPAFDVVAFSSRFEGLSIALLEAMAAARCLVVTRAAGITDVVDERHARLVPIADPTALRQRRRPRCRRRAARLARRAAGARPRYFTVDRMATSASTAPWPGEAAAAALVAPAGASEPH